MAFGLGGLSGAVASDLARWLVADVGLAYASVFALEALLFLASAALAWQVSRLTVPVTTPNPTKPTSSPGELPLPNPITS